MEIRRLAARETLGLSRRLRRVKNDLRALRTALRKNQRVVARLQGRMRALGRGRHNATPRVPGLPGRPLTSRSIRVLRDRLGMTRKQFSRALGVSPGAVFLWESGRSRPRNATVARIRAFRKTRLGARSAPADRPRRRARGRAA